MKQRLTEAYAVGTASRLSPRVLFITVQRLQGESLKVFRFRLERLRKEAFDDQDISKLVLSKFLMNIRADIKNNVEAHILKEEEPSLDSVVNLAATLERNNLVFGEDPTSFVAALGKLPINHDSTANLTATSVNVMVTPMIEVG